MLKRCALYRWSVTEKRQGPILNSRFSGALDVSVERCFEFVFFLKMVKMVGVNYLCALHSSGTTILPAVSKIMKLSTIPLFYLSPSSTITTTPVKESSYSQWRESVFYGAYLRQLSSARWLAVLSVLLVEEKCLSASVFRRNRKPVCGLRINRSSIISAHCVKIVYAVQLLPQVAASF